jgi:hypothetical protein
LTRRRSMAAGWLCRVDSRRAMVRVSALVPMLVVWMLVDRGGVAWFSDGLDLAGVVCEELEVVGEAVKQTALGLSVE